MNLLIVTSHPHLYTPRRFLQEGARLGWNVRLAAAVPWWRGADSSGGAEATAVSVLARPGPFSFRAVLRAHRNLARAGAHVLQSRRSLTTACDQWRTLRALDGIVPTPRSLLIRSPSELGRARETVPGPGWFVKGRAGSKGSHVLWAPDAVEAARQVQFLWGEGLSVVLQEDLRPRGPVHRYLVAGARVLAAARARPAPGEHRSNWHRGGRFEALADPDSEAARAAILATQAVGLPFAGVDAIGGQEPVVLEVNASPGLEGLEGATRQNLAGELLALLAARPAPVNPSAP